MYKRPALKIALLVIAGIVLAHYSRFSTPVFWLLGTAGLILAVLLFLKGMAKEIALCLSILALGGFRYALVTAHFPQNHITQFLDVQEKCDLFGVIVKDPELREDRVNLVMKADSISFYDRQWKTAGRVLVSVKKFRPQVEYGDAVKVFGRLYSTSPARNPGEFNYQAYLKRKRIYGQMSVRKPGDLTVLSQGNGNFWMAGVIYPIKHYLSDQIDRTLTGSQNAVLKGLLIGERKSIPQEVTEAFARSGVIHVLAVSGLHVGFIVLLVMFILGLFRIPFNARALLTILVIVLYIFITDGKASVVRAGIMVIVYLGSYLVDRKADIYNTIAVAALLILLVAPDQLFDVGFQLSFLAVLSIIYLYEKLDAAADGLGIKGKFKSETISKYIYVPFLVSIAAQLGTTPLTAYYFGRIPIISLAANLLVIPLVGLIVALGFTASLFSLVSFWLAKTYAAANGLFLSGLIGLVDRAAQLPFAYVSYQTAKAGHLAGYFLGLGLLVNAGDKRIRRWLFIFALILLNLWVWGPAVSNKAYSLEVTFLDVGQGDAAFLEFPDGQNMLIDGGERRFGWDVGERTIIPFLKMKGITRIDRVVISHRDNDHIGGLVSVIKHFPVGEIIENCQFSDANTYMEILELAEDKGIPIRRVGSGEEIPGYQNARLFVLHPTDHFINPHGDPPLDENNGSVVLKLMYGRRTFLFTGDTEQVAERAINRYGEFLRGDVLKVGHHGSITSSSQAFIQNVQPDYAVISAGRFNRFGHPSDIVLNRLKGLEADVLRTDTDQAQIFRTDGIKLKLVDWK